MSLVQTRFPSLPHAVSHTVRVEDKVQTGALCFSIFRGLEWVDLMKFNEACKFGLPGVWKLSVNCKISQASLLSGIIAHFADV
jgi:hypothetical protein